jgi:hypothetical protein
MSTTQKKHFNGFIVMVILADGKITDSEIEFWNGLMGVAELPYMSIEEARDTYINNLKSKSSKSSTGNSGCCLVIAVPLILVMIITMSVSYLA